MKPRSKSQACFYIVMLFSVVSAAASSLSVASGPIRSTTASTGLAIQQPALSNVREQQEISRRYIGSLVLVEALQSRATLAHALGSADLDQNGTPDLVSGYEYNGTGIVTVQRGNPEAFAPSDDSIFERMHHGYNPNSLLPEAEAYATPEPVDFLQVGDFNQDSVKDVLVAARRGGLYLLAGDGSGGLGEPEQIPLPGTVTALAAGEFNAADGRTDVAVGISTPSGPSLLLFQDPTDRTHSAALNFQLKAEATTIQFGALDDDAFRDIAVAAGNEITIIHGCGRKTARSLESRIEAIDVPYQVRSLEIGNFVWERKGRDQIAALAEDGVVHIFGRGKLDEHLFTQEEIAARARARLSQTKQPYVDIESFPSWEAGWVEGWTSIREFADTHDVAATTSSQLQLSRAHLSYQETDDLLLMGDDKSRLSIVSQIDHKDGAQLEALSGRSDLTASNLDLSDAPVACLALPQKLNGERNLVVMHKQGASQTMIPLAPTATITVDRTDDPSGPGLTAASACLDAVANDCSLRGAVQFANAHSGTVISLGTNTYVLNINGANGCVNEPAATGNTIGDLEVNVTTTFMGNGQANTIIRQAAATNDRVLCMDVPLAPGFTWTFSGMTITGGRDVNSNVGGGGFIGGARDTTLNLTNVTFANNQTTGANISGGGGVAVTGGNMNVTNCTFGAANLPGANRNDLTLANASNSNSGGGLSYSSGDPAGTSGATGTLTVTGTTFTHNTASGNGAGGLLIFTFNISTGSVDINTSTFSNNQGTGTANGGGILNESFPGVTVKTSTFSSNSASRGGGIYVGGGSLVLDGTNPSITFTGNSATVAEGGSSVFTASTLNVSGTNTSIGGDIAITQNGIWTNNAGSSLSPTNIVVSGGVFNCNNSTMNVGGDLLVKPGTLVGSTFNANTGTVNIAGNLTTNSGGSGPVTTFNAGTGTFNFNGSGAQAISGTLVPTFNNLTDSNTTQPLTANINIAVGGNLTVNASAIFAPVPAAIISGGGTLTGSGTARVTRTAATPDFSSQYTITNKTLTNLTVEYAGTAAQTCSPLTYGGLKINNSSGVNLAGTTTVNGTLTLTSGAFGVGSNTLNVNNASSVGSGSLTSNANGTVNYGQSSAGQGVLAANYGNLTFSNFMKVLPSAGTIGVAGTFTPGSGAGHTITGSTFDFNATGAQSVPAFNYNNLTISGARTTNSVTLANGGTIGVAGTFSPTATFTSGAFVITNTTINFNGTGAQTITAFNYNNITISGARTTNNVTMINGGTIRIAGTFSDTATFTSGMFIVTGNTVEYNGVAAQALPSAFTTYNNLTLNNTAGTTGFAGLIVQGLLRVQTGTFTSSSTYNNVQIDSGATLVASAGSTINVSGNWTNNGAFTPNNGTVNFNGVAAQAIAGASATTFNNLTINNASGVSLSADIAINGTLSLQSGALAIGTRTLTLNNAITLGGGSFTSAATGTVIYNQSSNGQSVAPGNYGNLTFSNFQKTLSNTGTIKIAGVFTSGAGGGHTLTGSTVEFNGTSAQNLPSNFTTYNNLTLNNPAGTAGFAGLIVQGLLRVQSGMFTTSSTFKDVQIDGSATLAATPASTINVSGTWTNNGIFTSSTGTVNLNGGSAQTVGGSLATTFNNLTINNASGVTLAVNATVNALLTLTSGDLDTGSFTLIQPAAGSSAGTTDVVGNVRRIGFVINGAALSFGNPFNTIKINSGTTTAPTDITVNLNKAVPTTPAPFASAIARKYTITPNGGSGISATLRLHYLDSELNGNTEGASLNLFRFDGTNWHKEGQTANDTTNNWVEKNNVTQFSAWTMNSTVPTEARLDSFIASAYDGGVSIEWQTGLEIDNLGFNIYRDDGDQRIAVNPQLIAGSALVAGSVLRTGRSYAWWDPNQKNKGVAKYWLEAIDLRGISTWHGPVTARATSGAPPDRAQAVMLGATQNSGATHPVEVRGRLSVGAVAGHFGSNLASQPAVKLSVSNEGWYRVTSQDLVSAGLDPGVDPRLLQMFSDGRQLAISVPGEDDGRLDATDAVEFYGVGLDTPSTDKHVYWLVAGSEAGQRIRHFKDKGLTTATASFAYTVERRDRSIYFAALRNGEKENFFGSVITSSPVDQLLSIQHLDQRSPATGLLEVALQGVSQSSHRVRLQLNGVQVGEVAFDGQSEGVAKLLVPMSSLTEGENVVRLIPEGGDGDTSLVDFVRLTYQHTYMADGDFLALTLPGKRQVSIGGFSNADIRVFDITDPNLVQELTGAIEELKDGFAVTATAAGAGERRLLAMTIDRTARPTDVTANLPSSLHQPANGADLLIITRREFFGSLEPLKSLRQSQGLSVGLVDIDDVYDEFSFGNKSPAAVKDFLTYARGYWKKQPRFVLFVGDASYDPRNYLGAGDYDLVPSRLIDTSLMEAASDEWFAETDEDGLPAIAIGRLPARSVEEVATMVEKIVGYDRSTPSDETLIVADANDGFDFEAASTRLEDLVSGEIRPLTIYRGLVGDAQAREALFEAISRGQKIVNYTGHGNVNQWRANLLTNDDAGGLDNRDHLSLFVLMTCLNGYFNDPYLESLGEALMKARGGAVAVWASSGITLPNQQALMNQELYRQLFGSRSMRLGIAVSAAKAAVNDDDVRRSWILLGDPTMTLR